MTKTPNNNIKNNVIDIKNNSSKKNCSINSKTKKNKNKKNYNTNNNKKIMIVKYYDEQ